MNNPHHNNYNYIVKDCLTFLKKHCLKKEEADLIDMNSHVDILRTNISYILTKHIDPLPLYITDKIDKLLQTEMKRKPLVTIDSLIRSPFIPNLYMYEGDVTMLDVECIVNPANPTGFGCYIPGHKCVDNQIHLKAGPKMRELCRTKVGSDTIGCGEFITTPGFNLPSKYVIHAVGPIYDQHNHRVHQEKLFQTYLKCLCEAQRLKVKSVAIPCISTGEHAYPSYEACVIAISTIKEWLESNPSEMKIIVCPSDPEDIRFYKEILLSEKWQE